MTSLRETHSGAQQRGARALVRRGWLPLLVCLVLGIVAGLGARVLISTRYTATATVLVTPTGVQDSPTLVGGRTNSDVINMDTEVQLVTSENVASQVQKVDRAVRGVSTADLIKHVSVTVPANTEILTIGYEAGLPAFAARLANDFATAYLQQRAAAAQATLTAQIDKITPQLTASRAQVKTLTAKLDGLNGGGSQALFVRNEIQALRSRINTLTNRIANLSITAVTPGQVRSTATADAATRSPSRLLFVAAGAAVGLLIGILLAWFRVEVRRRLRNPDDVRSALDLPVLGTVAPPGDGTIDTGSAAFQQYRRIANMVAAAGGPESKTVLVTGEDADSTGVVATNVLRAFTESKVPIALMPRDTAIGASELADARGDGYLIAVATDPRRSADAQTIARFSDSTIIVVDKGARTRATREILEQLDAVGAPVLGVVLVRAHRARRPRAHSSANKSGKTAKKNEAESVPATPRKTSSAPAARTRPATRGGSAKRPTSTTDHQRK